MEGLEKLIKVVAALRDPQSGCPWDLEQDHLSLLPYFFEELHEFREALESRGPGHADTAEELGDVLYQIVLHAQLLNEKSYRDLDQIAAATAEKVRRRHPHVFDPSFPRFKTGAEVTANWEKIKAASRQEAPAAPSTPAAPPLPLSATARLRDIPRGLGALQRAARIGEKAAGFDFDWSDAPEVWEKVEEEFQEVKAEFANEKALREELGDLLFVLAQFARKRGWDPEAILHEANQKFLGRFEGMEKILEQAGVPVMQAGRSRLEAAWLAVKECEAKE